MGMGLYGGEKIKWLTRERKRKRIFKNNNHYKLLIQFMRLLLYSISQNNFDSWH
ncbi:hypothetical protein HpBhutan199_11650 [Helicobacter pylori]